MLRFVRFRWAMRLLGPFLLVWVVWRAGDLGALVDTFAQTAMGPLLAAMLLNAVAIHAKL